MPRRTKPGLQESNEAIARPQKKRDDAAFNPKNANKRNKPNASSDGLVAMRAETSKTVEIDGELKPLKIAVVLKPAAITTSGFSIEELKKAMEVELQPNPLYRPIARIIKSNPQGSPIEIETPNKTLLRSDTTVHVMRFLTNRQLDFSAAETDIKMELDAGHDFFKSTRYQQIKNFMADIKKQEVLINQQLLNTTTRERKKNNFGRVGTQNEKLAKSGKASEGSATAYANATKLFVDGLRWEWLHLIAYAIWGAKSQDEANLMGGTEHANTLHIMIESQYARLAKEYPDGFKLGMTAEFIKKTNVLSAQEHLQIGTILNCNIITSGFTFLFKINAQEPNKPHAAFQDAVNALFNNAVKISKVAESAADQKENLPPPDSSGKTFRK